MRDNISGFLNINKAQGITSFGVCDKLKKKFHLKKTGHTGTLDPIAEGVLVVAINRATKFIKFLDDSVKEYEVEAQWGIRTDTYDITGKIIDKIDQSKVELLTRETIENLLGNYRAAIRIKIPPFSAKKRNGKPLYKYARKGIMIEGIKKLCYIYELRLTSEEFPFNRFFLKTSRGTYVRSLIDDIGLELGILATLKNIKRLRSGQFRIEKSVSLEELDNIDVLKDNIIDLKEVFLDLQTVTITREQFDALRMGNTQIRLPSDIKVGEDKFLKIEYGDEFIGIAKKRNDGIKILKIVAGLNGL